MPPLGFDMSGRLVQALALFSGMLPMWLKYRASPKPWLYRALIQAGKPDDVHQRASLYADGLADARAAFEEKFGAGIVVSLWGEVESNRPR